jgi:glycosyltransferase involved in cell wall biosynthesis
MEGCQPIALSILMPCLNEARTLPTCIAKARAYLERQKFRGEIIIADNGSTDGSREIAKSLGARLIAVPQRGYGNALRAGIEAARGEFVIMGDSDDSYDFSVLEAFVEQLEAGHDLVIGNRFVGGIKAGAMPPLHRYFGNPFLTALGRLFYRSPVNDFNCGLRGFRRSAMLRLNLTSPGMEFALEMIVKSTIKGLRIVEVPTTLSPDGRGRPPHLRTWRDGWRSLRFFLMLSPEWLFLFPGLALAVMSSAASLVLIFTDIRIGSVSFSHHSLIMTSTLAVAGMQSVLFWVFAKLTAIQKKLLVSDPLFDKIRPLFTLEKCAAIGGLLVMIGMGVALYALLYWYDRSFGRIDDNALIKVVCAASFLIAVGFQFVFSSFFIYLLDQKPEQTPATEPLASSVRVIEL